MWRNADTPFVIPAKAGIHLQPRGVSHGSCDPKRVGDIERTADLHQSIINSRRLSVAERAKLCAVCDMCRRDTMSPEG